MGGLLLDDGEIQRAIRVERWVGGGDKAVEWMGWVGFMENDQWPMGAGLASV